jgi:putative membrane protein
MGVVAIAAPLLALGIGPRLPSSNVYLPLWASLVELVVVWAWHTPSLHELARHNGWAVFAEQGSFLATGLFLWITSFGVNQRGSGIVALLLTAIHMTLLGALLALAPRILYAHVHGGLNDQQAGGVIMLLLGGASYLAGGLWLAWGLLSQQVVQERGEVRGLPF